MASATGVPEVHPATLEQQEDAPLLGGPGGATQKQDDSIGRNLISGKPMSRVRSDSVG